ncbi:MAG: RagB/SusD family nutrient uptake outer membrane protein [Paramuribaculum sp.]|jgi:hypothetical protein
MKKILLSATIALSLCSLTGCDLDYTNTGAISPDNVWTDQEMISAFLTDIYGSSMPGWPTNANNTDEGMNGPTDMSMYSRGLITAENTGQGLNYGTIDKINFFIDHLENVDFLDPATKNAMKGQALFWRAWDYWGKVFTVGGVPLILHEQDVTDLPSLFVSRNSTSECMTQIIADLDEAASLLPDTWTGSDYGRIDKGIVLAFKGRVLLYYASPLFNPNHDNNRWQQAYDANKAAVDFLKANGKNLYQGDFADIWYDERNCEVVMVNQYYYPDHTFGQNAIRPEPLTKDNANYNQAILPLLMAFPKKDGTPLTLDVNRLSDPAYNAQFMTDFYTNRDPRFHATILCPGMDFTSDRLGTENYWNTWVDNGDGTYKSMSFDQFGVGVGGGYSGYFQRKGVDKSLLSINDLYNAETDWIEIRFAEVLMNYGECANELGKTNEALDVLYKIRARAGIEAGTGNYGITASNTTDIREVYCNERFIEFAYEGRRFNDLRRWKKYDHLNQIKYRSTLYPVIKNPADIAGFDWNASMFDDNARSLFRFDFIENVDGDSQYQFNLDLNHWFYPLSKGTLDRNSKLEQNNEWGGNFNPLD